MNRRRSWRRSPAQFVNGKWLAQSASGTQRYATEVMKIVAGSPQAARIRLVLPKDAVAPAWTEPFVIVRSRLRGAVFEQFALPWIARRGHLYSLAGPAPLAKRNQTLVMHDATTFRHPHTFRLAFVLWYRLMYGLLARRAGRVFTVSSFSVSELADVLGVPPTRFGLAPCGSDHVQVADDSSESLPFERGSFALLVGNLAPHKNVSATVRALADADVAVVVVGGAQRQVFRNTTSAEHDRVRLLGRVDDARLAALYAGAGVLVAPSRYEGFGIPVVEAGRFGTPAVFATGSAMTEVAGAGGLAFDPDDLGRCVELVSHLLRDPAARAELAQRARTNAARYTWARTAAAVFGTDADGTGPQARGGPAERPGTGGRPLRVLHVTATFAAGTGVAIAGFARETRGQGIQPFLLAQDRGSGLLDELAPDPPFCGAEIVAPGALTLWRALDRTVATIDPDIVHVHSSVAGAVVRLRRPWARRPIVVYSPHCFAFERRDVTRLVQRAYRGVEVALAGRTAGFVCVSPHEARLAADLHRRAQVHYVGNSCGPVNGHAGPAAADGVFRLVSVGRLSPQKDPAMFAAIVSALRRTGARVEATWVGGGADQFGRAELDAAGVAITGWVPADQVTQILSRHEIYVHTAAWEAAPIAILDAMAAGLAISVRRIAAYREMLPSQWLFGDVAEAVEMICGLAREPAHGQRVAEQIDVLGSLRAQGPAAVLAGAYHAIWRATSV